MTHSGVAVSSEGPRLAGSSESLGSFMQTSTIIVQILESTSLQLRTCLVLLFDYMSAWYVSCLVALKAGFGIERLCSSFAA
mgnify:CR=1 FL=1